MEKISQKKVLIYVFDQKTSFLNFHFVRKKFNLKVVFVFLKLIFIFVKSHFFNKNVYENFLKNQFGIFINLFYYFINVFIS